MKTRNICFTILTLFVLSPGIRAQSTLALVESGGGCGLVTDCASNTICIDIILTPGVTADVQSYNLWVQYPTSGLVYLADSACITADGNDNDFDSLLSVYRVSGIQGTMEVTEGEPVALHTICFTYEDVEEFNGQTIFVGGTVFDVLFSTLTYNNPPSNEPMMPEFPFLMDPSTISCLEVLSVDLLSFEARPNGDKASLRWVTTQELAHAGFEIERSADGGTFSQIGFVHAHGGKEETAEYHFEDTAPLTGINYYRLKQIDNDGNYSYSEIRTVRFGGVGPKMFVAPNPTTDELRIVVDGMEEETYELQMVNAAGQVVLADQIISDTHQTTLDVSRLSPGVYSLVAKSRYHTLIEKIVVLQ